ncbi:hypothetical protein [Cytobacillus sp. IB215665]|uniref:hypothetical protein n=1 Tax=Cytobacillus sp. IB215665 TaxID=3097357 RepID=UPI002A0DA782|nr:hypothetical protein [Cytobacillus sp. IB215665]MDX8365436.1 hypothetical protein [Cytobacillus sp. IB215665]
MTFTFDFYKNVPMLISTLIAWGVIAYICLKLSKKKEKIRIWKIIVILLVGMFSLAINWNIFNEQVKIAILPIGVWILFLVYRRKIDKWKNYRVFAWTGFLANYIFIFTTLLTVPIYHLLYPSDELSTYISNVEDAHMINTHMSAPVNTLNKAMLIEQIPSFTLELDPDGEWYESRYLRVDENDRKERFPYLLLDTKPQWGSGLLTMIYIEENGKGLLISTPEKQLYFHSTKSIFERGEKIND